MSDPIGQTPSEEGAFAGRKRVWARRNVRIVAAIAFVLAVGGGGYGIASAVTGTKTPTVSLIPAARTSPSATRPRGGFFGSGSGRPLESGTVLSVSSNSFVIQSRQGNITVDVSSSTAYSKGTATTPASFADVKNGETVVALGASSGSIVSATRVIIAPKTAGGFFGGGGGGSRTIGTVDSVGTNSFVITTRQGSKVTVDVSSTTTFTEPGSSAAFGDVKAGDLVVISGASQASTLKATAVIIAPAGGPRGFGSFGGFGGPGNSGAGGATTS